MADTIEFDDAPAEYAQRPDLQNRISSFFGADAAGVALKVYRSEPESAGAAGGAGQIVTGLENAFGKRVLFFAKGGVKRDLVSRSWRTRRNG